MRHSESAGFYTVARRPNIEAGARLIKIPIRYILSACKFYKISSNFTINIKGDEFDHKKEIFALIQTITGSSDVKDDTETIQYVLLGIRLMIKWK